jgi:hypothetical protein
MTDKKNRKKGSVYLVRQHSFVGPITRFDSGFVNPKPFYVMCIKTRYSSKYSQHGIFLVFIKNKLCRALIEWKDLDALDFLPKHTHQIMKDLFSI